MKTVRVKLNNGRYVEIGTSKDDIVVKLCEPAEEKGAYYILDVKAIRARGSHLLLEER